MDAQELKKKIIQADVAYAHNVRRYIADEIKKVPVPYPSQLLRPVVVYSQDREAVVERIEQTKPLPLQFRTQVQGMNKTTGKILTGIPHLHQSFTDILTTRYFTRVMRRVYGSDAPDLVDAAGNANVLIRIYAAVAITFKKWEPRFKLVRIQLDSLNMAGQVSLTFEGVYLGEKVTVEGVRL